MGGERNFDRGARRRIVASARRAVLEWGEGGASSADVAAEAGVSKALVHYHFTDKRTLLLAVVDACDEGIERRRSATFERAGAPSAFDRCQSWLAGELAARDLEALGRLAGAEDRQVRRAAVRGLQGFGSAIASLLEPGLRGLALRPTIPMDLIVALVAATATGLAVTGTGDENGSPAAALDTLWLAILGLTR